MKHPRVSGDVTYIKCLSPFFSSLLPAAGDGAYSPSVSYIVCFVFPCFVCFPSCVIVSVSYIVLFCVSVLCVFSILCACVG